MKISFHTNAFVWAGEHDIRKIADYAIAKGFEALEVGPGINLNRKIFKETAKRIPISAMIYCRNFIDDDVEKRTRERQELWRRMEFASEIEAKKIIISTGISRSYSIPDEGGCNPLKSLPLVLEFLKKVLERSQRLGLTVLLENCPMYRNIATSPYMWRLIFSQIHDNRLGLCYDPSHFVWQMIDVYNPVKEFQEKIRHIHVKNTVVRRDKLRDIGILHNTAKDKGWEENQWWYHSLMQEGEIDWKTMLESFGDAIPDLSFEMEDYRFQRNPAEVALGLEKQMMYLKKNLTAIAAEGKSKGSQT